ncbi:MAG: hypothetical protein V3S01_06460 [Dehalococcoidia bacterium]
MAQRTAPPDQATKVESLLDRLRETVESGERHWFIAVLEGVGQWPLAEEEVNGRRYRYMIGGEAFDWLLLAERLCEALDDLTAAEEREALLMHGRFPTEVSEETFRRLLGAAKYRAHLNFRYGVQVEEALQLSVAQEVEKDRLSRVWENGQTDDDVCSRIYGATRRELFAEFQREQGLSGDSVSLGDLHEFTYWLFKHRVNNADPARVASDTRKGLAMFSRMQAGLR